MSRTAALLLALLCVVSAPALSTPLHAAPSPAGTAASVDGPNETDGPTIHTTNTTARLALVDVASEGRDGTVVDVGTSVEFETDRIGERHREVTFETRLDEADSADERGTIIEDELDRIEDRRSALVERERTAYRSYANGEIDERDLLRDLGRVHAEASQLEGSLSTVEREAIGEHGDRAWQLRIEVSKFQGPVREAIVDATAGERDPVQIHVQAGQDGLVLSMIDGNTFHRESYRPDQRDRVDAQGQALDQQAAIERHYPWVAANRGSDNTHGMETYAGLWRGIVSHPHGELTTFLDTGTESPFREFQSLQLDALPTEEAANETVGDLTFRIDRTYPAGPALVTLTEGDTAPHPTFVFVDDEAVVGTNVEGEAWFVAPGDTVYVVSVTVDDVEFVADVIQDEE